MAAGVSLGSDDSNAGCVAGTVGNKGGRSVFTEQTHSKQIESEVRTFKCEDRPNTQDLLVAELVRNAI